MIIDIKNNILDIQYDKLFAQNLQLDDSFFSELDEELNNIIDINLIEDGNITTVYIQATQITKGNSSKEYEISQEIKIASTKIISKKEASQINHLILDKIITKLG